MFEYSREPEENLSQEANRALFQVCELGAMPAWLRLNHGVVEQIIDEAGFVLESTEDATDRMLPMLRAFAVLGQFPYVLGRMTHLVPKVVNAMSGVEMYKHRDAWRYNIYVARKPLEAAG